MRIIGVVPARSGSQGIPGKNARVLAGYPLVSWSIIPALAACDVVILTSNDPEVLALGWVAERLVVHRRSPMLATDRTPDLPVVLDAYQQIDQEPDDVIVLLRPTAPFRREREITDCASLFRAVPEAHSVRSVLPSQVSAQKMYRALGTECVRARYEPVWLEPATEHHRANHPRQALLDTYAACGFIDAVRADILIGWNSLEGDRILGWPAPIGRASIEMDKEEDFFLAETIAHENQWTPGEVEG